MKLTKIPECPVCGNKKLRINRTMNYGITFVCKKGHKPKYFTIRNDFTNIKVSLEEKDLIENYRAIKREAEAQGLNVKDVKHGWLKNKTASLFFTNPEHEAPSFDPDKIDWNDIIKPIKNISATKKYIDKGIFDRLVYTDVHIGMNPNPDGYSLYGGKWDAEEVDYRNSVMIDFVVNNRKSKHLNIDDLGDLMDGLGGQTARKGHDLPQNMDDQEAFDVGMRFKIQQITEFLKFYETVNVNCVVKDNHSAEFGYMVNSAVKAYFNGIDRVKVNIQRKFIDYYKQDNYTFIVTHGKDDENLKTGFKPHLTKEDSEKIDNFLNEHYLIEKDQQIQFSKGDSHQGLFDWASSERFNYFNYPAFSPSSNWVQTNFKKGKSGFFFFNYMADRKQPIIHPYFFDWKNAM